MLYRSHIGQDRWVAEVFGHARGGWFLDFGAFDGITISNTFALEKQLGWTGICVEPNPRYYPLLCATRSAVTVNAALWAESRRSLRLLDVHGLSSLEQYAGGDDHAAVRQDPRNARVQVDTVNPTELLARFGAPPAVHYLSLDVEGAEVDVLRAVDLDAYRVALLTVEHNHRDDAQAQVRDHLARWGYGVVQVHNEDWFWRADVLAELGAPAGGESPGDLAARVSAEYGVRAG